jgi:hypothetical protein
MLPDRDDRASREPAVRALRRYVGAEGCLPTVTQQVDELPSAWTIRRLFGSWSAYITAAGFAPRPYRAWSADDVLVAIREWMLAHDGQPPSRAQWSRCTPIRPSAACARRLFGTWTNALRHAGSPPLKSKAKRWTNQAILEALTRWAPRTEPRGQATGLRARQTTPIARSSPAHSAPGTPP